MLLPTPIDGHHEALKLSKLMLEMLEELAPNDVVADAKNRAVNRMSWITVH